MSDDLTQPDEVPDIYQIIDEICRRSGWTPGKPIYWPPLDENTKGEFLVYEGTLDEIWRKNPMSETTQNNQDDTSVPPKSAGELAFDRYSVPVGGKSYSGQPLKPYSELSDAIKAGWDAAAPAAIELDPTEQRVLDAVLSIAGERQQLGDPRPMEADARLIVKLAKAARIAPQTAQVAADGLSKEELMLIQFARVGATTEGPERFIAPRSIITLINRLADMLDIPHDFSDWMAMMQQAGSSETYVQRLAEFIVDADKPTTWNVTMPASETESPYLQIVDGAALFDKRPDELEPSEPAAPIDDSVPQPGGPMPRRSVAFEDESSPTD